MAILDAVERGARSFTDIVEATGLTRPTAHRLLRALEDHRLLTSSGARGYRLGPRLLGLAGAALRDLPLRDLARPSLEDLSADTGESAQIYVRDDDRRICVDAVESSRELRTIVEVGSSLPLAKGSAGTVFLAWASESDRSRILAELPGEERNRRQRQVAAAERQGWAESVGERAAGVASVSAPVLDADGLLVGVVSVSGPAERIGRAGGRRYAPAVVSAAQAIRSALGGSI